MSDQELGVVLQRLAGIEAQVARLPILEGLINDIRDRVEKVGQLEERTEHLRNEVEELRADNKTMLEKIHQLEKRTAILATAAALGGAGLGAGFNELIKVFGG